MSERLPIVETALESYRLVWTHRARILRYAWPALGLIAIPWILGTLPGFAGASKIVSVVLILLIIAGYILLIPVATRTYRLLAGGDFSSRGLQFKAAEWRFVWAHIKIIFWLFLWGFLISILLLIATAAIGLVIALLIAMLKVLGPSSLASFPKWILWAVFIPTIVVMFAYMAVVARYVLAPVGAEDHAESIGPIHERQYPAPWVRHSGS